MKADSLLKSTMLSDTRKGILYLLLAEPRSLTELRVHFGVKSSSIIPRLKELLQVDLIVKENGKYWLTTKGTIVAKKLQELDGLERVMEHAGAFFNVHDLSPIPPALLDRICELGDCRVITNGPEHITATHDVIYDMLPRAKKITGISPVFDPRYPGTYLAMAELGIPVSIVITESIFSKVEKDYRNFLEAYLSYPNTSMYALDEARLTLVATDDFLAICLYGKDGTLDPMNSIFCRGQSAAKWGTELFEGYRQKAREIKLK